MSLLTRINQKVFGSSGGTGEFGAFGSDSLGAAVTTKNLETIQSLAPYLQGLFAATNNANEPPRIQDINGLYLLFSSQLAYLFQNGIPEWHADAEYYAGISYCQVAGTIFRSVTGEEGNPNKGNNPATDDGTNWEAGDWSLRQLKFDLDRLGFSGYALYTDRFLQHKRDIAMKTRVGDSIISSITHAPTAFSAAQSTAHPTYPEYFPAVCRTDADHDISTAQVPQWVIDDLNATVITLNGVSEFTATLAGGVLTFGTSTTYDKLLALINEFGMVNQYYHSGESATYAASGAYHAGTRQYCVTIGGVNYAITACSVASRTISLATAPANGTVTVEVGINRIAGSTTSSRLRKISGQALVAAGDVTGEVVPGGARMDRFQHWQLGGTDEEQEYWGIVSVRNLTTSGTSYSGSTIPNYRTTLQGDSKMLHAKNDGTNGTPRTGKTTDPRTVGMAVYTHLAVVNATNWT